jgi:hypothetical protein
MRAARDSARACRWATGQSLKPEWINAWLQRHALGAEDRHMYGREPLHSGVRSEATS